MRKDGAKNEDQSNSILSPDSREDVVSQSSSQSRITGDYDILKNPEYVGSTIKELTIQDKNRRRLLQQSDQTKPLPFADEFPEEKFKNIAIIRPGAYSVVFQAEDAVTGRLVVLKVIRSVADQVKKTFPGIEYKGTETFEDVHRELFMIDKLAQLRYGKKHQANCFPKVLGVSVVTGPIPDHFLENKVPIERANYQPKKEPFRNFPLAPIEFVVLEMKHQGQSLTTFLRSTNIDPQHLISVVNQTIAGLAVAETACEFEHRDMHINNILVKPTNKPTFEFRINNMQFQVPSYGVKASIIDTTFSRIKANKKVCYKDLTETLKVFNDKSSKEEEGEKKKKETLQETAYRQMVGLTKDDWHKWSPKTNVVWLKYLVKKICHVSSDPVAKKYCNKMYLVLNKCETVRDCLEKVFGVKEEE